MKTVYVLPIALVAALISSCSSGGNTPVASPSTPGTSVSPSIIPSPSMSSPVAQQGLDLDPVPFFFAPLDATSQNLPDWMSQLSTVQTTADAAAYNASVGILAVVGVYYNANNGGDPTPVFSVQYMPEEVYADFQNMDGPQEVGNEVISSDGNIIAIFGPQGELFEHGSIDQQIVDEIVDFSYNQQSYQPTIN
jgi:hypothetical protein